MCSQQVPTLAAVRSSAESCSSCMTNKRRLEPTALGLVPRARSQPGIASCFWLASQLVCDNTMFRACWRLETEQIDNLKNPVCSLWSGNFFAHCQHVLHAEAETFQNARGVRIGTLGFTLSRFSLFGLYLRPSFSYFACLNQFCGSI